MPQPLPDEPPIMPIEDTEEITADTVILRADHMAAAAEQYIAAAQDYDRAQGEEYSAADEAAAEERLTERHKALRSAIYEYQKRRSQWPLTI